MSNTRIKVADEKDRERVESLIESIRAARIVIESSKKEMSSLIETRDSRSFTVDPSEQPTPEQIEEYSRDRSTTVVEFPEIDAHTALTEQYESMEVKKLNDKIALRNHEIRTNQDKFDKSIKELEKINYADYSSAVEYIKEWGQKNTYSTANPNVKTCFSQNIVTDPDPRVVPGFVNTINFISFDYSELASVSAKSSPKSEAKVRSSTAAVLEIVDESKQYNDPAYDNLKKKFSEIANGLIDALKNDTSWKQVKYFNDFLGDKNLLAASNPNFILAEALINRALLTKMKPAEKQEIVKIKSVKSCLSHFMANEYQYFPPLLRHFEQLKGDEKSENIFTAATMDSTLKNMIQGSKAQLIGVLAGTNTTNVNDVFKEVANKISDALDNSLISDKELVKKFDYLLSLGHPEIKRDKVTKEVTNLSEAVSAIKQELTKAYFTTLIRQILNAPQVEVNKAFSEADRKKLDVSKLDTTNLSNLSKQANDFFRANKDNLFLPKDNKPGVAPVATTTTTSTSPSPVSMQSGSPTNTTSDSPPPHPHPHPSPGAKH